jgi:ABC-2 type transport system permease protein
MNLERMRAVLHKELREILRDRIYCLLALLLAPMMMLVFCYGMSQDVENVPFALLDYDRSPMSRDYAQHYISSRYFRFRGYLSQESQADRLLAHGDVRVVLIIPHHFQEQLLRGEAVQVQALLDGTFTIPARTVQSYVEAIGSEAGAALTVDALAKLGVPQDRAQVALQPLRIEVRYLYNEQMRNMWTVAPTLIMVILMWTTPLLVSLSVVREKESGSIYNVYCSTLSRAEFLAGKMLPNVLIGCFNALVLFLLATVHFGAPFRGDPLTFALATVLFVVGICGIGMLTSFLVRTQQAALMVTVILSAIIVNQYSGLQTPIADLQGLEYGIAHLLPVMYYTTVIQETFLKGSGFASLWDQLLALAAYAGVMLMLPMALFHKRVRQ